MNKHKALRVAFGAMICLLIPFLAGAEQFTPQHIARVRQATSAEISPDGSLVAYTLSVPRKPGSDDDGPAWSELHLIRPDGSSVPFITGEVTVTAVQWTPSGKAISFLAKRGSDKQQSLYSIPIDGGEARRILTHKTDISSYEWHPEGNEVVFIAGEKKAKKKEDLEKKGFKAEIYEEELLAKRVYVAKIATEDQEPRILELKGSASIIRVSPDGNHIAVALAPTPLVDDDMMQRDIQIVDYKTGEEKGRIDIPGKLGTFEWSPDGRKLAIMAGETIHDPREGRLFVAGAEGGALTNLLPDYEGHVSSLAWQDKDTVMFISDVSVWATLSEVRTDGTQKKDHVAPGKAVIKDLSVSEDGNAVAFLGEGPKFPPEVFTMRHGDSAPKRLTDSNPWLAQMDFAPQTVVRHKARDGLMLEGILIEPLGREAGKRYPLILNVHGGPEAHDNNGWLNSYGDPGQVAAARGMAVFYPNYRGSTGRGVKFSMLGQADYAGAEFDDLIDAVDHLIESGLVDKAKVGVTGGSYGGYATAWCSTYYSDRFAAGVMFVGVSDLISKTGTTDIPNEMHLVHARKWPWDDWNFFLNRSPIRYVEKARTPLLIMHGKEDTRVHPSQSMELYRHLKVLGKAPVRLVWYPGEGHGNRKSAARYDFQLRMLQWFEHYLKGPGGAPPPHEPDYDLPDKKDDSESK